MSPFNTLNFKSDGYENNDDEFINQNEAISNSRIDANTSSNPSYKPHNLKTTLAGISGNILEWYDFAIFGYFSEEIGNSFFAPNQKGNAALVEAFAVYGLAFLARPIGGLFIGRMGDMNGRKGALETSIFYMAFSTFAMAILPTYEMVGTLSTVLLILTRLIQGLSVGGQLMSSILFTIESTPISRWGFMASTVFGAISVGVTIGSLFAAVINDSLSKDEVEAWGWRIPFVFGLAGLLPALFLKHRAEENFTTTLNPSSTTVVSNGDRYIEGPGSETQPIFNTNEHITEDTPSDPIKEVFKKSNRRPLIAVMLAPSLNSAVYYLIFVWLLTFMTTIINPPIPHAFNINSINGLLGGILLTLFGGWFADWVGDYAKIMFISALILGITSPFAFSLFGTGSEYTGLVAFSLQLYLSIFLGTYLGAMMPWLIINTPRHIRLTLLSLGYNISLVIWGGFSPLLATILVDQIDNKAPGYLISVASSLALIALWIGRGGNFQNSYQKNEVDSLNKPLLV